VSAAGGEQGDFSLATSLVQMVASLALVVGVILLFYYFASRWFKVLPGNSGGGGYIRLVETRYLAPKKSLMLVEVGGEYLLLSSYGDGVRLIKQIDMIEEIEVLEERGTVMLLPAKIRDRISAMTSGASYGLSRNLSMRKSGGLS
jgi:flagellar protein FliO/FliZ